MDTGKYGYWAHIVLLTTEFLKKHNSGAPGQIRVITDLTRTEFMGNGTVIKDNPNAGEEITTFIRQHLDNIPVLVWTPAIDRTQFVQTRWLVGSTRHQGVVQSYINQLAGLGLDCYSVRWAQYDSA